MEKTQIFHIAIECAILLFIITYFAKEFKILRTDNAARISELENKMINFELKTESFYTTLPKQIISAVKTCYGISQDVKLVQVMTREDLNLQEKINITEYDEKINITEYDEKIDITEYDEKINITEYDEKINITEYDEKINITEYDEKINITEYDEKIKDPELKEIKVKQNPVNEGATPLPLKTPEDLDKELEKELTELLDIEKNTADCKEKK